MDAKRIIRRFRIRRRVVLGPSNIDNPLGVPRKTHMFLSARPTIKIQRQRLPSNKSNHLSSADDDKET